MFLNNSVSAVCQNIVFIDTTSFTLPLFSRRCKCFMFDILPASCKAKNNNIEVLAKFCILKKNKEFMKVEAGSPEEYIARLPEERKAAMQKLREVISVNIPEGFEETMSYGMIGFVVPHSVYPSGYHCNTKLPLPFVNIASQKNFIALYHMGIYADSKILDWFINEYSLRSKNKLDMGKSCIRFKKADQIPFELIGELVKKITVDQWIKTYEANLKK